MLLGQCNLATFKGMRLETHVVGKTYCSPPIACSLIPRFSQRKAWERGTYLRVGLKFTTVEGLVDSSWEGTLGKSFPHLQNTNSEKFSSQKCCALFQLFAREKYKNASLTVILQYYRKML